MSEVSVTKKEQPKGDVSRWFGFDTPVFRSGLFSLNPYAMMRQFADDMDRTFAGAKTPNGGWMPAIEVKQKDGKFCVSAELPGVKKEDVKVHIDGDMLALEGERKEEKEEKKEGYFHSERRYGKFYRAMALPEGAKADQASAQFNNGILEVTVPVVETKQKRQDIPIKAA